MHRILTLVLAAVLACGVQAQQTLQLMANTSPPYADDKLPGQGLAPELLHHVFEGTPWRVKIDLEGWSRALEGARLGVYDGLATAWYSQERAQDLLFTEPYLRSELIVLKRREDPRRYERLEDLAGRRLGVLADYAYGVDFTAVRDLVLVEENHLIQNLLKLLDGSVDLVVGDRRTVTLQIHEYLNDRITQFVVTELELPPVARHVAISRAHPEHEKIVAAFNRALAAARDDGTLDDIVARWDAQYRVLDGASAGVK